MVSYSHIQNFTITVALTKTFASASSDSSLILVTSSCATNDEIYAKSVTEKKKRKKTRKAIVKLYALHANAKNSHRNNTQYLLYFVPESLGNFFGGLLERSNVKLYNFFPVPAIVETAMDALSRLAIYLFIQRRLDLILKCIKDLILSAPSKSSVLSVLFSSVVLF